MSYPTLKLYDGYKNEAARPDVQRLQALLNQAVGSNLTEDGWYGPQTEGTVKGVQRNWNFQPNGQVNTPLWLLLEHLRDNPSSQKMYWGSKVSQEFRAKTGRIASDISSHPDSANWLMSVMAFETGETFDPKVSNYAGSGATGLIQFMPRTAAGLLGLNPNSSSDRKKARIYFANLSAIEQLEYVHDYFRPYKGRLNSLADMYMAVLYPAAVGKSDSYVLFDRGIAYSQNRGLDFNRDGKITKREAARKVEEKYTKGRQFEA